MGCCAARAALPVREEKARLRRRLLAARVAPAAVRDGRQADSARLALLLGLPELASAAVVAVYSALPGEPSPASLTAVLRSRGRTLLLPRLLADGSLELAVDEGLPLVSVGRATLGPGPCAPVLPPTAVDVVVVPALAVDRCGRRLGRGGGSYDRLLAALPSTTVTVALLHAGELLDRVPGEPHDRPVRLAVTPDEVLRVPGW